MVLEALAEAMMGLIDWGRGIIVFLIVMELFKASRGTDAAAALGSGAKSVWKGLEARIPGTISKAKRVYKEEINEFITEDNEEKRLDVVREGATYIAADLEAIGSKGELSSYSEVKKLLNNINALGKNLKKVKNYFRKLNRRTSRAQSGLDDLFTYLERKGVKDRDIFEKVKAIENSILKQHQEVADEVAKVESLYGKIMQSEAMEKLKSMTSEMFESGAYKLLPNSEPLDSTHIYNLAEEFKQEAFLLKDAYEKEAKAKQEVQGLMSYLRGI